MGTSGQHHHCIALVRTEHELPLGAFVFCGNNSTQTKVLFSLPLCDWCPLRVYSTSHSSLDAREPRLSKERRPQEGRGPNTLVHRLAIWEPSACSLLDCSLESVRMLHTVRMRVHSTHIQREHRNGSTVARYLTTPLTLVETDRPCSQVP